LKNFTQIYNQLINNPTSYGICNLYERGFYLNILQHSKGWIISDEDMKKSMMCSNKTVQRTRKEMISRNLIKSEAVRKKGENGVFIIGFRYQLIKYTEKLSVPEPETDSPPLNNTKNNTGNGKLNSHREGK